MSNRSNFLLRALVASALSVAVYDSQAVSAGGAMPPPEVSVTTLRAGPIALNYAYPGRAGPFREVEVHARVAGILKQRVYTEGAKVKAGDVLFRIDPIPFEIEVAQAQAQLQQAKSRLAQAESDAARSTQLFTDRVGSAQAHDNSIYAMEIAKAGVAVAEAALKTAEVNLGYTTVTAPIDGVTSLKLKSEGGLVDAAGASSLLARITQVDPIYVNFSFGDRDLTQIQGMLASGKAKASAGGGWAVRVTSGDDKSIDEQGSIDFIDSNIDAQTGTIQARAVIPNKNGRLRPGQFLQLAVTGISLPEALVVPRVAVMQGAQGPYVYAVDVNNKALLRPITLGREVEDGWIVASGVSEGDRIITNGMIKVMPGAVVSVDQLDASRAELQK